MTTEVSAHIYRKVSDGAYGSTEIGFSITDEVKEDEKVSTVALRVYDQVETLLNAKLVENGLA